MTIKRKTNTCEADVLFFSFFNLFFYMKVITNAGNWIKLIIWIKKLMLISSFAEISLQF